MDVAIDFVRYGFGSITFLYFDSTVMNLYVPYRTAVRIHILCSCPHNPTEPQLASSNIQKILNCKFQDREKIFSGLKKDYSSYSKKLNYTTITQINKSL